MRNLIWNEMCYAKKNDEYITIYISFQKSLKKFFEMITLILTSSGFIAWLSTKNTNSIIVGISIGLAAFVQLLQLLQDKVIVSDEYINDVIALRKRWISHFDKLEKLWLDLEHEKVDDIAASDIFLELKIEKMSIEEADSGIKIWKIFFLDKNANELTNNYMTRYYG